ncbi:class II aldolase/adducin family protein [Ilumatobacter sp.]|uniref:class II aldolase/adducin family protein n=1 Tax=Ilumatobacter sp. TaxID=1967498 RepID=UPI003C6AC745
MDEIDESEYPPFDGVEPYGTVRSIDAERAHRKRMCAIGYRIFAAQRWGQLGDGHISARDPEFTDHFWLLDWGVPFGEATVGRLVLVGPDGEVKDAEGNPTGAVNTAGYNIHAPILAARPDAVSAAHTHTQFGTPWSANVEPFRALSQESCAFVLDQSIFDDEEVEVLSVDGGKRIAAALGDAKLCILRNHGPLTVGRTVEAAVAWFVMAERVAEVHVKAPDGRAISDEAAEIAASTLAPEISGWRVFQWLQRSLVSDPSVVD